MAWRLIHLVWLSLLLTPFFLIQVKPLYSPASYDPKTDTVIIRREYARDNPAIQAHEAWHRQTRLVGLAILACAGLVFVGLPIQFFYPLRVARGPWLGYIVLSFLDEFMAYLVTPMSLTAHGIYVLFIGGLALFNYSMWRGYWRLGVLEAPLGVLGWRNYLGLLRLGVFFWLA